MDYPNRVKNCATCNRWGGRRVIANPLNLPNYEIVKFDEIDYEKWKSEDFPRRPDFMNDYISSVGCGYSYRFLHCQSLGAGCKRYTRWNMLGITVIDKALQLWCSRWYARRSFNKSKSRESIDSLIHEIQYFILKCEFGDSNLVAIPTSWFNKWIMRPIFALMYRLKFTTHEPLDLMFSEDCAETK